MADSGKNILTKSGYSAKTAIEASSAINEAIWAIPKG